MSATDRLQASDGLLYRIVFGSTLTSTTAALDEEWHKIISIASTTTSALPSALAVGDLFYAKPATTLAEGDTVQKLTKTALTFVTDATVDAAVEVFEKTTQTDDAKSWAQSDKPDINVTVGGYYEEGTTVQDTIEQHFYNIITDDGAGTVAKNAVTTATLWCELYANITTTTGDTEKKMLLPLICESLSKGKPLEGMQPFSFNAKVNGEEHPAVYKRTITS